MATAKKTPVVAAAPPAKKPAPAKAAAAKPAEKEVVAAKPVKKAAPAAAAPPAKPAAKGAAAKSAVVEAPPEDTGARKPNAAFMKAMTPSPALAAVVGSTPLPRTEVTKKIWDYIKKYDLQDAANRRNINADAKLKAIFGGKEQVSMFEMTKLVSAHLS